MVSDTTQEPVVVRIDVTGSALNYYVGSNHAAKHNVDVAEGQNMVMVQSSETTTAYDDTAFKTSYIESILAAG